MPLHFHQNMRVYGGNSPHHDAVFGHAFAVIQVASGPHYVVAGFTEVMNAGAGLRANLPARAQQFFP